MLLKTIFKGFLQGGFRQGEKISRVKNLQDGDNFEEKFYEVNFCKKDKSKFKNFENKKCRKNKK